MNPEKVKTVVKQVAGSMALSGMELTEDDKGRISQLLDHTEEMEDILQEMLEKHAQHTATEVPREEEYS